MCNRCTRVCDEMIGVTAIESSYPRHGSGDHAGLRRSLNDTALHALRHVHRRLPGRRTDRPPFRATTRGSSMRPKRSAASATSAARSTSNRTRVSSAASTNLWERGVNHGYICETGRWGHEQLQNPDRIFYPYVRDEDGVGLRGDLGRRDRHRRRDARPLPGRPVRGARLAGQHERRGLRAPAVHPRGHGHEQHRPHA